MFTLWLCWSGWSGRRGCQVRWDWAETTQGAKRSRCHIRRNCSNRQDLSHLTATLTTALLTTAALCSACVLACVLQNCPSSTMITWPHVPLSFYVCVYYEYVVLFITKTFLRTTTVLRYCNVGIPIHLHIDRGCNCSIS